MGVHGLLEDNPSKPNSSENKKNSCKLMFQYTVAIPLVTFQRAAMTYCRIFMNMKDATSFFSNCKFMFCVIRYIA